MGAVTGTKRMGQRLRPQDNTAACWIRAGADGGARRVEIDVDGRAVQGVEGECLATALAAAGITRLGWSPGGRPRGAWCLMGVCQQCTAQVDGTLQRTCMLPVRAGLSVIIDARSEG